MSGKPVVSDLKKKKKDDPFKPPIIPKSPPTLTDMIIARHKTVKCTWCGGVGHSARVWTSLKHFKYTVQSLGPGYRAKLPVFLKNFRKKKQDSPEWESEREVLEAAAKEAIDTIGCLIQTL